MPRKTVEKLPPGFRIRKDGMIEARKTIAYRSGRERVSVYGRSVAEVAEDLARLEAKAARLADPTKRIVGDFLTDWLEMIRPTSDAPTKPQVRYNTFILRRTAINRIVADAEFGRLMLAEVTEHDVDGLIRRLRAKGVGSRATQVAFETLRAAFNYARKRRLLTEDIFVHAERPGHEPKADRAMWTTDEHRRFVEFVLRPFDEEGFRKGKHRRGLDLERLRETAIREHLRESTMFAILATTGARVSEVLGLTWDRIDLDNGLARIEWTLTRQPDGKGGHVLTATDPKTAGSKRTNPLLPGIVAKLRELHAKRTSQFVFETASGKPIDRVNAARSLRRYCKRADVKVVSPHKVRASVATVFAASSANTLVLVKSLGWSNTATAAKFYTKPGAEIAGAFSQVLSGVFCGVNSEPVAEKPI